MKDHRACIKNTGRPASHTIRLITLLVLAGILSACQSGESRKDSAAAGATAQKAAITDTGSYSPATVETALPKAEAMSDIDGLSFLQSTKLGWNLGNAMDAWNNGVSGETAWGNPKATAELFKALKAEGFGIVRIPVTWLGQFGSREEGYRIREAWLARLAELTGFAHDAGLKVIINIHHDGADSHHWLNIVKASHSEEEQEKVLEMIRAIWSQIATYFRNHGEYLVFEGFNEIHDGGWGWGGNRKDGGLQYDILNEWNEVFVETVRATGGNNERRFLTVEGYVTNPELTMEHMVIPEDSAQDRLLVSVHCYDPSDYAIFAKVPEWGKTAKNTLNHGQEAHFDSLFRRLKTRYIDVGIPVYIGEYGAVHQAGYEDFRRYYMEYVTKSAYDNGLVPVYWDNGARGSGKENFGLFVRNSGKRFSHAGPIIEAMQRAVTSDYRIDDIVLP